MPDVCQRAPGQRSRTERSILPRRIQNVQQQRKAIQHPERRQQGNEHDAAHDGGGSVNIGCIAVAQVMHRGKPQRQAPELLHGRDEQQCAGQFIQQGSQQKGQLCPQQPGMGGAAQTAVVLTDIVQGGGNVTQDKQTFFFSFRIQELYWILFIVFIIQFSTKMQKIKCENRTKRADGQKSTGYRAPCAEKRCKTGNLQPCYKIDRC